MKVVFVHGWSVRNTDSYGELPRWLAERAGLETADVYLGKYVSLDDAVAMDDLARAFERARAEVLAPGEPFACVTHSTGGPVVRAWLDQYCREGACPMSHMVMLAPANHGSALAQLGKSRLGRLKHLLEGVEPGERLLDWLELGGDESWALNSRCTQRPPGVWQFVLTGQSIDRKSYDHLNSYTGEAGSDGVVRAAAANMNYTQIRLRQRGEALEPERPAQRSSATAFGILPGVAHSGERMGIQRSVRMDNAATHPTAQWVPRCLRVASDADYARVASELAALTGEQKQRCTMLVFRIVDDRGYAVTDYDLYLTAGPSYDPDALPRGFFIDRQRNRRNPACLTYYLDYDVMQSAQQLGFRVSARPEAGLVYYTPCEFRSELAVVDRILRPNETVMVEIELERRLGDRLFQIERVPLL